MKITSSRNGLQAIGVVGLLIIWAALAATHLVSPLILPTPLDALAEVFKQRETMLRDVGATLARLLIGFVAGASLGVAAGAVFGMHERLYAIFELVIDFFRSLPVFTLFPLAMIIFGLGNSSKVALTIWTVFLLAAVSSVYGIKGVPRTRILAARTLGASGWRLVWKVYLPSAAPAIAGGLRLAISLGLVVVVVTEMFMGTTWGLGKRIYDSGLVYEIPTMYGAILIAGVLGFILNKSIEIVERHIAHWSGR